MFDQNRLNEILAVYKQVFVESRWKDEKYKWEAVKWFQDNWDVNSPDFADMLNRSLDKTSNLLASVNNFPRKMIVLFAKVPPEEVRAMFIALFDEREDIYERIRSFKQKAEELLKNYGDGAGNHYQSENAISTYLWLRFPEKYYIYKYSEIKSVAEELSSNYQFKKGAYADNIRNFYKFYDELNTEIRKDEELKGLLQSQLDDKCYSDPELRTLTFDIGFYISRYVVKDNNDTENDEAFDENDPGLMSEDWFPTIEEYSPGFTTEQWLDLLSNKKIIRPVWGGALAAFYEAGGAATCKQIAEKYHRTPYSVSGNCTNLAKSIYKKTSCPIIIRDNGQKSYWPILFQGKKAEADIPGSFIWKLRPELMEALQEFDIMRYRWKIDEDGNNDPDIRYWWLNANPKIWSYSELSVGEEQSYTLFNDNGNKRRIFQNFLDAKKGDLIIGYESHPVKQIVALAKISQEQDGEKILFEKTEGLVSPIDYQSLKDCPELKQMEYFQNPQGSLFKLTKEEYGFIVDLIREENPIQQKDENEKYSKEDFLNEVYMTENRYDHLVSVLKNKKNIILQGAPGVGKTFTAKRLAYSLIGEKDESRIEFVQFHQNYSYEDFMMGYKPVEDGFELKYGIFYRFCQKAANQPDKDFFFIIDEINRGNMSKIFGELLMLIENDYRGTKATLAYNGMSFSVPRNLYIIGMMNTADRSLAMIDYALRRRFSFFEMEPGFDSEGFIKYRNRLGNETFNELIKKVQELNNAISSDKSLGKGFCIGHSYFCTNGECTEEWMHSIVDYDLIPMLNEYWFDDLSNVQKWENILQGVFQ